MIANITDVCEAALLKHLRKYNDVRLKYMLNQEVDTTKYTNVKSKLKVLIDKSIYDALLYDKDSESLQKGLKLIFSHIKQIILNNKL